MENFEYCNPTRVIFGKGEIGKVGPETRKLAGRVLLVTGRGSVKRTGVFDRVAGSLEDAGVEFVELDGVRSNPLLSKTREGVALVRERGLEAVVALGGGSVMDTGKAVAAGVLLEEGDLWDLFTGRQGIHGALPVVAVPTLAASGSEMNGYMVITNEETGHKLATGSPFLHPRCSILDPSTTYSVPGDYTAYGGVDALCHLLEPYFNGPAPFTPVQDRMAEGLVEAILEATPRAVEEPGEYRWRAAMMWAASLALCGLTKAGVGEHRFPVHLVEHSVSALFDVPHGAGLAALLPGWMAWYARAKPGKLAQLGRRIWRVEERDDRAAAMECILRLQGWFSALGCPTCLKDLGISARDHGRLAENASFQARVWGIDDEYDVERIEEILGWCQDAQKG